MTAKNPELSPKLSSLTPTYRRPFAGITIACELPPIGNGAPLSTRAIRPPAGIAATGSPARGPAVALPSTVATNPGPTVI